MKEEKQSKPESSRKASVGKSKITQQEEEVIKFWKENKIFEKSLKKPSPKGDFVFFEGPPTANGKPGIHHLEARAFKDIIPRYKTMKGYRVPRKGGWDTHGLPVELQVEKQLGLKSKKEIEKYGIAEFNEKCKESVWEYLDIWNKFTKRIGFWIDQDNPYITYKSSYIESLWQIIKKVNERELLYKDYKVVPWCPRCGTVLSSHELAQGYETVKDLSVTVKFKVKNPEKHNLPKNTYFLAWTTTPWTLPGNIALAVGEKIDYVKIEHKDTATYASKITEKNLEVSSAVVTPGIYIIAKDIFWKNMISNAGLSQELRILVGYYNNEKMKEDILGNIKIEDFIKKYEIKEIKGKDLTGLKYEPLYDFLKNKFEDKDKKAFGKAYKVYSADFVTTEEGTGIVHTAVMYGQDDFELGTKIGLPKYHLVKEDGHFIDDMDFLSDKFVKSEETDVEIIKNLAHRNLLLKKEKYEHTYPFCWRCKTPLIYYARDSWYIKMSDLRDKLVKENKKISWEPEYIKEGRFGEWLREVKDWAISRERYWGTPLPIWVNEKTSEITIIGSIEELKKKTKKSSNKYFVMRHGEAESNIKNIVNANPKNIFSLTEKGRGQVKMVAQDIKSKKIDLVISSPFERCKETAKIVMEVLDLPKKQLMVDERLWELKTGEEYEGKKWDTYIKLFPDTKKRFTSTPGGGETLSNLNERVGKLLYELENEYSNKNILLVSHESTIDTMQSISKAADLDMAIEIKNDNQYSASYAEFIELDFKPFPHNKNFFLDLHKPYIDEIELINKNGSKLTRVKEVLDVWFDSGAMPFAQYADDRGEESFDDFWKKIPYPADFISEAIDQTRGWFYTLHAIGNLMGRGRAYKNVISLGLVLDNEGKKMSKSVGNVIDPWEMMDKYGADALRFWMYSVNQPGDSKNFDEKTVDEVVKKVFNLAGNILSFYELYKGSLPEDKKYKKSSSILDRWILIRLNQLIKGGEKSLDKFKVFEAARAIRDFINDFSTWYIRRSRDRFKSEDLEDKKNALMTTRFVLKELSEYMAPFTPFFAEYVYQKVKNNNDEESVHLCSFPKAGKIDEKVLDNMEEVRRVVSLALEKRNTAGIKVRQPLGSLKVKNIKLKGKEEYLQLIKDEINVREVKIHGEIHGEIQLDTEITKELKEEGNVREFIRFVQALRKDKGLTPSDSVNLLVQTDKAGEEFVKSAEEEIKKPTNVSEVIFKENDGGEIKIDKLLFKLKI